MKPDDYFNKEGKYLGSDLAPTDNVQIISQGNWDKNKTTTDNGTETIENSVGAKLSDNITDVSLKSNAVENIVAHYDSKIDDVKRNDRTEIVTEQLGDKGVLMESRKGGGIVLFGIKNFRSGS